MNKRNIHVIVPMAGEGKRFKDAGIDIPKPLVEFNGKYLFEHACSIMNGIDVVSWTFIVRAEHEAEFEISKKIKEVIPNANVIVIRGTTRGAAETVMIGVKSLLGYHTLMDDSLVILDCDVLVEAEKWKEAIQKPKSDGILLSFHSNDARYSYAAVKGNKVTYTAEKNPISEHALTSPYFFKSASDFIDSFHELENFYSSDGTKTYKEMYMSIIYNFLMTMQGKTVTLIDVDKIVPLGTPEELESAKKK